MQKGLESMQKQMEALKSSGELSGISLRRRTGDVAEVMLEEVVDWQILYRKPVSPA